MSTGPEFAYVEQPFIDQLIGLGWKLTTGNLDFPSATGRSSFREVIIHDDLAQALRRINRNAQGDEWLDESRIATAVSPIERVAQPKLMEANQAATELLLKGTTVEALAGILTDNRTRFLIGRDELSGWLASFNQYKAKGGSDQANWLELHSLGTLCVDRKTGEPKNIFVRGVGVSICGGIQPGVLRLALSPQHFSAGVPARLLFAYPPRRPKEWTEADIDEEVEKRYERLVKGLAALKPLMDDEGEPYPVTLRMTPEAKEKWVAFYQRFAHIQAETDGDLAAAFSKLEGYAARLALLHHVCQSADAGSDALEPVAVESVRAGIALAEWFSFEASRVYQMLAEETEEEQTRKLVEVVIRLAGRHGGRVTVTQLQRSNQHRYRSAESAAAALKGLAGQGLGRWESGETTERGGRPSQFFVPCITSDETDETPEPDDTDEVTKPRAV